MFKSIKKYRYHLIAIFTIGLLLTPNISTHASTAGTLTGSALSFLGLGGAGNVPLSAGDVVFNLFGGFLYLVFTLVNYGLYLLVKLLDIGIHFQVDPTAPGLLVVRQSWKIIRDFSNMFFIVIMIIMAFSAIFDLEDFGFFKGAKWDQLLTKLIIAALLINFSLVICGMVISTTGTVTNTFLNGIGDFSTRMGQALKPQILITGVSETTAISASAPSTITGAELPQLFFSTILLLIVDFSLAVAALFSFIRVPILWLLMILSPLAWITSILPKTRKISEDWWKYFIGWNTFLPILLFSMYFGMFFLSKQSEIINSLIISNSSAQGTLGDHLLGGTSFGIQTLFFYIVAAIIFVGGTKMALSFGNFAGTGVTKVYDWSKDRVSNITGYNATAAALKQYQQQVEKKGVNIGGYKLTGGSEARERRVAAIAGAIGVTGARERALAKAVADEKKSMKDEGWSEEQLRTALNSGGNSAFAAADLLLDDNKLSAEDAAKVRAQYGSTSVIAKNAFDERARKKLDERLEKGLFKDEGEASKYIDVFRKEDDKDGKDFTRMIEKLQKKDAVTAAGIMAIKNSTNKGAELNKIIENLTVAEIVQQKDSVFKDDSSSKLLKDALKNMKLSQIQIQKILEQDMPKFKRDVISEGLGSNTGRDRKAAGFGPDSSGQR